MKRSRFSEEQIIAILREQEAGAKTVEVCRKHGISDATFYKWKARYGGMEVSDARRLKALEDENAKFWMGWLSSAFLIRVRAARLPRTRPTSGTAICRAFCWPGRARTP